ncbi:MULTISPECIES: polysaccharide deacetylase family protein [unclassified Neorhizobium]|uniref:polysaccharide deacetylase family protein n=1 Tax=unclassified Neorhizobium TaxID=2629175 RepID=UPI001FF35B35|nr:MULTISPECIES: polysaccharide deacetylase family protein [unclassified Neorhizobium]MCJ9671099.1 polysaccharide deacetylase family protein [Neorhizobium sp. SHOUNA12B]MCJ9743726.1 polysaccharide deacetylase family protein [Neorhizobium sp. SHOUNA12A]
MFVRVLCVAAAAACLLSSCAGRNQTESGSLATSFAPAKAISSTSPVRKAEADSPVALTPVAWGRFNNPGSLSGRTLTVSSLSDIKLANKEVILTFDDGPMPKKTEKILSILDEYNVKATFLMVGQMAKAHPEIARKVVDAGHAIGSHTYRHADLQHLSFDAAIAEIEKGRDAVISVTHEDAGFFRFPYLADTRRLRQWVASNGMVVLDVQIDSKDYFGVSPAAVATRTMNSLRANGKGIILLHDIHARTAAMLPALLTQLQAEGYKVVRLRHSNSSMMLASLFD